MTVCERPCLSEYVGRAFTYSFYIIRDGTWTRESGVERARGAPKVGIQTVVREHEMVCGSLARLPVRHSASLTTCR